MSRQTILSIGNFDGVHRGHQAILAHARQLAAPHAAEVVALTFDPHPARTLRPGTEPPRLTSVHEKVDRLRAAGADRVVVLEPTSAMLGQSPQQFIGKLVDDYAPIAIVEGPDFRFGKARVGDLNMLRELGKQHGYETHVVPSVEVTLGDWRSAIVSSSLVRWLVGRGRVLDAHRCLGAPFELTGPVATGEQRGRTINVPTANLDPAAYSDHIVPADGVYAGLAVTPDAQTHPAALSVGVKPTFGQRQRVVEAHLLDYTGNLYGETITLRFTRWLRDQYRYPNLDMLTRQLHRDIALVRYWHEYDQQAHAHNRRAG
ncbi:riboflavin biosynthesis protein RibF [Phycisphaerales bacterium AB-hyl4]|uniref:Riboflavin biosynthesis protein n=1 Tax=Natronomicrosphaera hydrolytica TaxID=3242702 RepID=A0ABV4U1L6_9BACT